MRKAAATLAVCFATLGATAGVAAASPTLQAGTPSGSYGYASGWGAVDSYSNYQQETCLQVYNSNGNWYNVNYSCYYPGSVSGEEAIWSNAVPYTNGHTYRTWYWCNGVGTKTSGSWTP